MVLWGLQAPIGRVALVVCLPVRYDIVWLSDLDLLAM